MENSERKLKLSPKKNGLKKPTLIEKEKRNRIRLAVAAYAYEFAADSILTDEEFDKLAYSIQPKLCTFNKSLDAFFRTQFKPYTGMWIYSYPDIEALKNIYENIFSKS